MIEGAQAAAEAPSTSSGDESALWGKRPDYPPRGYTSSAPDSRRFDREGKKPDFSDKWAAKGKGRGYRSSSRPFTRRTVPFKRYHRKWVKWNPNKRSGFYTAADEKETVTYDNQSDDDTARLRAEGYEEVDYYSSEGEKEVYLATDAGDSAMHVGDTEKNTTESAYYVFPGDRDRLKCRKCKVTFPLRNKLDI